MFLPMGVDINEEGHLAVGGVDTVALAAEYGLPIDVLRADVYRMIDNGLLYMTSDHRPSFADLTVIK